MIREFRLIFSPFIFVKTKKRVMSGVSFMASRSISEGEIDKALDIMKSYSDSVGDKDSANKVLQLQAQWASFISDNMKGILSEQDRNLRYNKILSSCIVLKDEIKKLESAKEEGAGIHDPEITALVYTNAYACMTRDEDLFVSTFHPEVQDLARQNFSNILQAVDAELVYEIKSLKILNLEEDFAIAEVEQRTRSKVLNVKFRENEMVYNNTFKKENGFWKMQYTVIKKLEYFDK